MPLKLFLVRRHDNYKHDVFTSFIVAQHDASAAKLANPARYPDEWDCLPDDITADEVGTALPEHPAGFILHTAYRGG